MTTPKGFILFQSCELDAQGYEQQRTVLKAISSIDEIIEGVNDNGEIRTKIVSRYNRREYFTTDTVTQICEKITHSTY